MSNVTLSDGEVLLVASRGAEERHGLWSWSRGDRGWVGKQLATVTQLSSLARHPRLPVVYGTSRVGLEGAIHAWRIEDGRAATIGDKSSEGAEPCHLAVDPDGRLLIITNYTTSTLAIQNPPMAASTARSSSSSCRAAGRRRIGRTMRIRIRRCSMTARSSSLISGRICCANSRSIRTRGAPRRYAPVR